MAASDMSTATPACPLTWPQQRRNLILFALSIGMNYLAAPVLYIGITQASLCDKLKAATKTANIPATLFFAMTAMPALIAWASPRVSALKRNLTICYCLCGAMLASLAIALRLDLPNEFKIGMVILQGGVSGAVMPAATAYLWEAVGRGSEESRRGLALGLAFGMGPILAVIGSLGQAVLLGGKFFAWEFAKSEGLDGFVTLFAAGVPMMLLAILFGQLMIIPPPEKEAEREPLSEVVGLLVALPAMLGSVYLMFRADMLQNLANVQNAFRVPEGLASAVLGLQSAEGGGSSGLPLNELVGGLGTEAAGQQHIAEILLQQEVCRGVGLGLAAVSAVAFIYHFRSILRQRTLLLATLVTILVYSGNMIPSNMNLYSAEALARVRTSTSDESADADGAASNGKDAKAKNDKDLPAQYAGLQNTLRFSFKVAAGLFLGWLLTRTNPRAGILATSLIFMAAPLWAIFATGPWYLVAFGIYGAGELVGVYAPNYIVSASPPGELRKNTAFMTLLMMPAAPAGYLYGTIVDAAKNKGWTYAGMSSATLGFRLSFLVCAGFILAGMILAATTLPKRPRSDGAG